MEGSKVSSIDAARVASHLRRSVGELVRVTRGADALSPIPAAVMDLLDREGPLTTADLASRRQVRHQTMSVTVKELLDAGLLLSIPHRVDGRKKMLDLTPEGRRVLQRDRVRRVTRLTEAIETTLDDQGLRTLARALELIDQVAANVSPGAAVNGGGRAPDDPSRQ